MYSPQTSEQQSNTPLPKPSLAYTYSKKTTTKPHIVDESSGLALCGKKGLFLQGGFDKSVDIEDFVRVYKSKTVCQSCAKLALAKYSLWSQSLPDDAEYDE